MANTVVLNGNTYTDDSNPATGMDGGGWRDRFIPCLSDMMIEIGIVKGVLTPAQANLVHLLQSRIITETNNDYYTNVTEAYHEHLLFCTPDSGFINTLQLSNTTATDWFFYIKNSGLGILHIVPNGSNIDGLTELYMYPHELRLFVFTTGTGYRSVVLSPFCMTFTATQYFAKPTGYSAFQGLLWGGGGGAAYPRGIAGESYQGGGGGSCLPFTIKAESLSNSQLITIGAGGSAAANDSVTVAGSGGTSSFSSMAATGGGGAGNSNNWSGGGGGGTLGIGSSGQQYYSARGGEPFDSGQTYQNFGGGRGCYSTDVAGSSVYGGGGGGGYFGGGGISVYGGGGGGSVSSGTVFNGGISKCGGSGGAASLNSDGGDGVIPGGGGGASMSGTKGGDGARGELRLWGII